MKSLLLFFSIAIGGLSISYGQNNNCPPEGKARQTSPPLKPREENLNVHKNRNTLPNGVDFDKTVTAEKMYNSNDDSIFSANKAATIEGYILKGNQEGVESCNCYTTDATQYDTHIYLSPTPITNRTKLADCIVIEITPYSRTLHPEWTTPWVNSELAGKKVKVTGWLTYDYIHHPQSASNPNVLKPVRHSIWEIHPITNIQEIEGTNSESEYKLSDSAGMFEEPSTMAPQSQTKKSGDSPDKTTLFNALLTVLLGMILGGCGQGARVIIGLKKVNDDARKNDKTFNEVFEIKKLLLSLLYALIIGSIAGIFMAVSSIGKDFTASTIIAIMGAGYAGTDFIEGFVNNSLKK